MKAVIYPFGPKEPIVQLVKDFPELEWAIVSSTDELAREIPEAAILVTSNRVCNAAYGEVLRRHARALRWFYFGSSGIERGIAMGIPEGITVTNSTGVKATMVSEHAVSLLLGTVLFDAGDLNRKVDELKHDPAVEYAEPDHLASTNFIPNDPYYSSYGTWGQAYDDLWGVKKIGTASAWDTTAGAGITVAIVDTGIDYNHPDIASNIWTNTKEVAGNGIDDDNNGYVDDTIGWDFIGSTYRNPTQSNNPIDHFGHGTHVAGTVAAVGNNGTGVIGVAWQAHVMAVKGLDDSGYGLDSTLGPAIIYAANNGAEIISNSWSGQGSSQTIADAVGYAYNLGAVVVAAAGNNNTNDNYIVGTIDAGSFDYQYNDYFSFGIAQLRGTQVLAATLDLPAGAWYNSSDSVTSVNYSLFDVSTDAFTLAAYDAFNVAVRTLANIDPDTTTDIAALRAAFVSTANGTKGVTGTIELDPAGDRVSTPYAFWSICAGQRGSARWLETGRWTPAADPTGPGKVAATSCRKG